MANIKFFVIYAFVCVATAVATNQDLSGPKSNVTSNSVITSAIEEDPLKTTVPPTKPTTTSKTTISPNTTVAPTTPSTTPAAPNTTVAPTTPSTTTTPAPNTTVTPITTPAPTTTAAPPVDPKEGTWIANYTNTNNTCLVVQIATQIDVEYKQGNDTKKIAINVPPEALSQGKCDENQQSITLTWNPSDNVTDKITFTFKKTNESKFDLQQVDVVVNVSIPAQGYRVLTLIHKTEEFVTPLTKSYKCTKEQSLNLTSDVAEYTAHLRVSHVQMQAFRNATDSGFDEALDCMGSETPDVVPIAVGCALAALVIIVLIAYLIGRRRSQARGYLSM